MIVLIVDEAQRPPLGINRNWQLKSFLYSSRILFWTRSSWIFWQERVQDGVYMTLCNIIIREKSSIFVWKETIMSIRSVGIICHRIWKIDTFSNFRTLDTLWSTTRRCKPLFAYYQRPIMDTKTLKYHASKNILEMASIRYGDDNV